MRTDALERAIRRRPSQAPIAEPCSFCALELPDDHPHILDVDAGRPLCVCRACALLFDRPAAARGRYRRMPSRRLPLQGLRTAQLRVPVGLAFFVVSDEGPVLAHYPSPAGATRWVVDPDDWQAAQAACSPLGDLEPEVEAVLVNSANGRSEAWIVPVSDCYRLVAIVGANWQGLSGGDRVWQAIEAFFEELRRKKNGPDPRRHTPGAA